MKIYIAGFFDTRARLRPVRDKLRALGYRVLSSWLDEEDCTYQSVDDNYRLHCASRDLAEIGECDLLIVDTYDVTERGGREFEAGFAAGRRKQVWQVGPKRNVFHYVCRGFSSWEDVYQELDRKGWRDKNLTRGNYDLISCPPEA